MRAGSKDELCVRLYFRAALRAALLTAAAKPAPGPPSAARPAQPRDCQQHWEPVQCCSYRWVGSGHHFVEALLPSPHSFAQSCREQPAVSAFCCFPPFFRWKPGEKCSSLELAKCVLSVLSAQQQLEKTMQCCTTTPRCKDPRTVFRPGHCTRMAVPCLACPLQTIEGLELLLYYAGITSKRSLSLGVS